MAGYHGGLCPLGTVFPLRAGTNSLQESHVFSRTQRAGYLAKSGSDYVSDKAGEPAPPSFTGDPFGYNKARREWAQKLDIDPYTTNPVLRPLLDKAASASFAGNFAVSLTLGAVMAPVQYAYSFDETVSQSIWNKPPVDLIKEGVAADGRVIAALAIDYGTWDKDAATFVQRKELAANGRTLLVAGKLSPRATKELEKAGWTVKAGLRA